MIDGLVVVECEGGAGRDLGRRSVATRVSRNTASQVLGRQGFTEVLIANASFKDGEKPTENGRVVGYEPHVGEQGALLGTNGEGIGDVMSLNAAHGQREGGDGAEDALHVC